MDVVLWRLDHLQESGEVVGSMLDHGDSEDEHARAGQGAFLSGATASALDCAQSLLALGSRALFGAVFTVAAADWQDWPIAVLICLMLTAAQFRVISSKKNIRSPLITRNMQRPAVCLTST